MTIADPTRYFIAGMPIAKLPSGVDLQYEAHGAGEPLLLIMGTGLDHRFWSSQVPAYAEHFHTIVYDARGVGKSTVPADPTTCSMAVMADDAAQLLDALGIEVAHVSGLNMGSAVAQELCLRHPRRVLSAQLHGTWGYSDEWLIRMIETLEEPLRHGELAEFIRYAMMWTASPTLLEHHKQTVAEMEASFLAEPPDPVGVLGHLHASKHHDTRSRLHDIACPVLVASGEMDAIVPPRYGREVAERVHSARFHLILGMQSSHLCCIEMADEFNRFTLDWLRSR